MTFPGSDPLPDEPQSEVMHSERVSPVWRGLLALMVGCVIGMVFYALLHDPNAQHTARAPGPGAAPLPDSPALTTTGERVPLPGDRATGTVIGPDVKTAPPPPEARSPNHRRSPPWDSLSVLSFSRRERHAGARRHSPWRHPHPSYTLGRGRFDN